MASGIDSHVGPPPYQWDIDAISYFGRAESLGGSFNQTAINPTYTSDYVKRAINNFVKGCKTDAIWDKLTEVYLLAGVSFGGLMAKLKFASVATTTNFNFVAADYLSVGSGGGLKGNASDKRVETGIGTDALDINDFAFGVYVTQRNTVACGLFGNSGGGQDFSCGIVDDSSPSNYFARVASSSFIRTSFANYTGEISVRRVGTSLRFVQRQVVGLEAGSLVGESNGNDLTLFARGASFPADARLSAAWIMDDGSTGEITKLHTRTNALMTALGANVY